MTGVEIRRGGALDLPQIMPVMRAAFDAGYGEAWTQAQCLGVVSMSGSSLLIAEQDSPIGFALSRHVIDECELMLLAVTPAARRRGVGQMLLNQVIADARAARMHRMLLEMRAGNSAITLYSSAGFGEIGRRRDYYRGANGETFDALTYQYLLT